VAWWVGGCSQAGVLSLVLCNLVVDELKRGSVRMAAIHWGMPIISICLSAGNL
jgi:hypothetical protein